MGQPLGALVRSDNEVIWSSAPGRQHRLLEADIVNEDLYRLVDLFLNQDARFLEDTLTGIENALGNILPHSPQEELALLVGRPLAVVRASIRLELLGLPATDQNWNRFWQTVVTHQRDNARFTAVTFPIRVGEHARLNDGLVGFWRTGTGEDGGATGLEKTLYLPQTPDTGRSASIDHPDIVLHRGEETPHLQMALDTPAEILTMLIEPRSAVHLSSGILPVETLALPSELYLPALKRLEITFFSGPFVTKQDGGIELPIPTEPGYTWSLLSKENGAWHETQKIQPVEQNATFSQPHVLREGWLKLTKEGETR